MTAEWSMSEINRHIDLLKEDVRRSAVLNNRFEALGHLHHQRQLTN
jgi:hypothetical protein